MRKIIWIAHISLDGYVANKDGKLDDFESGEDNLAFVEEICREADTILSGRITYELLNSFWPQAGDQPGATSAERKYSSWYNGAKKMVATRTPRQSCSDSTCFIHGDLAQYVQQAKSTGRNPIVIFGSPDVAGQLMEEQLIDSAWIFVNPVIFGVGVPLFATAVSSQKLKLNETRRFANGETALNYMIEK